MELDHKLDLKTQVEGGFSDTLNFKDRVRLRKIVKTIHLRNYPAHLITDYEADKVIDVLAPATMAYLIEKNWAAVK